MIFTLKKFQLNWFIVYLNFCDNTKKYFYLIHIQYLCLRIHGWAKQTNVKTVHQMIEKTILFVSGNRIKALWLGWSDDSLGIFK